MMNTNYENGDFLLKVLYFNKIFKLKVIGYSLDSVQIKAFLRKLVQYCSPLLGPDQLEDVWLGKCDEVPMHGPHKVIINRAKGKLELQGCEHSKTKN